MHENDNYSFFYRVIAVSSFINAIFEVYVSGKASDFFLFDQSEAQNWFYAFLNYSLRPYNPA